MEYSEIALSAIKSFFENDKVQIASFSALLSLCVSVIANLYMERRRKKGVTQKYIQSRRDIIKFLKNIELYRGKSKMDDYVTQMGEYRFGKLIGAFTAMKIFSVTHTQGGLIINIQRGMSDYGKVDIQNLIKDVKNGHFDSYFDL